MLAVLRQRNFALLWFGGLISMTGDWVLFIGLPIYIYQLSGSALATSLMFMAQIAPRILLGSLAGVFVDRWDRRRVLVVTNLLLAVGLLPILLVRSVEWLWVVYIVAFSQAVIRQFCGPAEGALLPNLVGDEELLRANSLNTLSENLARLVGPVLGGLGAAYLGLTGIALLDAASFVCAGLMSAQIRSVAPTACPIEQREFGRLTQRWEAFWGEWAAGLRIVARSPVLTAIFLWSAIVAVGEGVMSVLFVVFVARIMGGGAAELGWLMSAQAVGGILGSVVAGRVEQRIPRIYLIGFGSLVFGLIDLAIFNYRLFYPDWRFLLPLFLLVGMPGVWTITAVQALLQTSVGDRYRGRILGARGATMALLGLLGTLFAGAFGEQLGVVSVLNVQGGGYMVAGLLVLVLLQRLWPTRSVVEPAGEVQSVLEHTHSVEHSTVFVR